MGTVNKEEVDKKAQAAAEAMRKLPESVQFAVSCTLPNFANGCYWGFIPMTEAEKYLHLIKEEKNLTARKIGDYCVIEVNPKYLATTVASLGMDIIREKDIQNIKKYTAQAFVDIEKFLLRKGKKGFEGTIGIYCTNDTPVIKTEGKSVDAFRLSAGNLISVLTHYGYQIKVNNTWVTPSQAVANGGQALFDSMKVSPTKTGVFLDIKSTFSPEQMIRLEAEFNKKYGISK